ncbi:MAG: dinitrogenase iron-molybdenum cofactor biosynthesis protein [Eggerthellaceae bacterium]|nr:dinitrogenase iron-molybdenum cofactor biosynthesis protein [Eggerthellaceae bacterium]
MRIAIPSETDQGLESLRSGHFGHAAYFTLVTFDDDMNVTAVESVQNVDHDTQGCGGVIEHVIGLDVDGILTAGMGMPPFTRFTNAGITVYQDATRPKVADVVELFAAGQVPAMDPNNACRH